MSSSVGAGSSAVAEKLAAARVLVDELSALDAAGVLDADLIDALAGLENSSAKAPRSRPR